MTDWFDMDWPFACVLIAVCVALTVIVCVFRASAADPTLDYERRRSAVGDEE